MFSIEKSRMFQGNTMAEVGSQIATWFDSLIGQKILPLKKIYQKGDAASFAKAAFSYSEQKIGFELLCDETYHILKLRASYKLYMNGSTLNSSPVTDYSTSDGIISGDYNFPHTYAPKSMMTGEDGITTFTGGAWYGFTDKGGLLVGLYSDDITPVYQKYPVYLGSVQNAYTGSTLYVTFNLNRGTYPNRSSGSAKASATGHSVGLNGNKAGMPNGGAVYENDGQDKFGKLFLQHLHPYYAKDSALSVRDIVYYTPLFAYSHSDFSASDRIWVQPFQVDDFFAGIFNPQTHPPLFAPILIDDKNFVPVTDDGVAVISRGRPIQPNDCFREGG